MVSILEMEGERQVISRRIGMIEHMACTQSSQRLRFFAAVVVLTLSVLIARLWQLQVIRGEQYYRASEEQRLVRIPISGARGDILDRNGHPLATNRLVFTISLLRETHEELLKPGEESDQIIERLAGLLGLPAAEVRKAIETAQPSPEIPGYQLVELTSLEIPPEAVCQIVENREDYPGFIITRKPVRYYPNADVASQIIGYVRRISPEELSELSGEGYLASDLVGKLGIEKSFEKILRDTDGGQLIEVDRTRTLVQTLATESPSRGGDVVLTIDLSLQAALERAIDEQIAWLRSKPEPVGATGGAGVVIDIKTGQILAAATRPGVSPELYATFSGPMSDWPGNEMDKVTKANLPPGSVWKPVTLLAALAGGVIGTDFVHVCDGRPDPELAGKSCHAHGKVDLVRALEVSCNAYLWTVGKLMWREERAEHIEIAQKYAVQLGLGRPTGIQQQIKDMGGSPDVEASGNVPLSTPRYGDSLNSAIGQGSITVTPLQIAQFYATVARSGIQIPTSLVLEVRRPDGTVIHWEAPEASRVDIDPRFFDIVKEGLRRVPISGTAAAAFSGFPLDEIPVAGKTGTAEIPGRESHGWFAAYAPADDPKIAIAVVIENGGYGSQAAAPVVRRVLEHYFGVSYETSDTTDSPVLCPE